MGSDALPIMRGKVCALRDLHLVAYFMTYFLALAFAFSTFSAVSISKTP
ncbi:hypothetical protein HMPREF9017_01575 [Parascardovia denticolens F0305]|nr:hypothetical protein HMPREF9017_01575 [Parascardovia denticolens F0305]